MSYDYLKGRKCMVWTFMGNSRMYQALAAYGDRLSQVGLFSFKVSRTGVITESGVAISNMLTYINRWPHIKWLLTISNDGTNSIFAALRDNTDGAQDTFLSEIVRIMEKYPNMRFDLTPGHEMYMGFSKNIPAWREFFKKYENRILFGTDATTTRTLAIQKMKYDLVAQALSYDENEFPIPRNPEILVRGLHLDREIIENIAYNNFIDFAGEKAAPVNMDYVRAEAKKLLEASKAYPELGRTVELLEEFLEKTK